MIWRLAVLALCLSASSHAAAREAVPSKALPATGTVEVLFTPGDNIEARIVEVIQAARQEILVHAFSFTNRKLADALIAAHQRGIRVEVTSDREQTERTAGEKLSDVARSGVPVWFEQGKHPSHLAHNKVMVIDANTPKPTVLTGSYNWTVAAQRYNSENLLVLAGNRALAQQYRANWQQLREGAQRYVPVPASR